MESGLRYLFVRGDTFAALALGGLAIVALTVAARCDRNTEKAELILALVFGLSFPFWCGFAYADLISMVMSPFIACAFGAGFALAALRTTESKKVRITAGAALAMNLIFAFFPATIAWTTRYF